MKRMILVSCLVVCLVPFAARADHEIDWNDWFEGDVQVRLRVDRGEGALFGPGAPVSLKLEANEDAYHLVYAIDTDGYVRLLFPRYWEDDGWLFAHEELHLRPQQLAWPANRWGSGGIVYVEAVSSPVPFDFTALGVGFDGGQMSWVRRGRPFHISGDPFLAFNEVHRLLFPVWDEAVFAVDYTYFYVGQVCEAPRYLGYSYQRVVLPPPTPVFSVGLRFVWHWEFGRRYCRPTYTRYYAPGRHVVYHAVRGHHHVTYRSPAPVPPPRRRPGGVPWVAPERRRVVHETPVMRHRERPESPPRRERTSPEAPRVERKRSAESVAELTRRAAERTPREPERARVESREDSPRVSLPARTAAPVVKRRTPARELGDRPRQNSAHPPTEPAVTNRGGRSDESATPARDRTTSVKSLVKSKQKESTRSSESATVSSKENRSSKEKSQGKEKQRR